MIEGLRVIVVVPARGGSKGIPLKNIQPLLGKPLVAHVGEIVGQLDFVDRAVVSTDNLEIAQASRRAGLDVPFVRSAELSGDLVGDLEVLAHALLKMERIDGVRYDITIMLQPTSPLRKPEHVAATVRKLVNEQWDAVWTVSPTDVKYHPLKQLRLDSEGVLDYFDPGGRSIIARQQLSPVFHRNGAAYAFTRSCLLDQRTIMPPRSSAVVLEGPMVSIDTPDDFQLVENLMRKDHY